MVTSQQRDRKAKTLASQLSGLNAQLQGKFQCPTCMNVFDILNSRGSITAAHIVPNAAGGARWTLLCKKCNSDFGRQQDKWFGEYLSVLLDPDASILSVKTKSKYIEVNGERVSGRILVSKDRSLDILLPIDLNPPGKVDSIKLGPEVTIRFTPELVRHEFEIKIGYLTAAYLMWFDALGYNWVYQAGLDVVREQILNPREIIWEEFSLIDLDQNELVEPCIAILPWSGHAYAVSVIYDRVVIFPPPVGTKVPPFRRQPSDKKDIDIIRVTLGILSEPYILAYESHVVVLPNVVSRDFPVPKHMLRLPADVNQKPQWLSLRNGQERPAVSEND